jgi:hypothetical protein
VTSDLGEKSNSSEEVKGICRGANDEGRIKKEQLTNDQRRTKKLMLKVALGLVPDP